MAIKKRKFKKKDGTSHFYIYLAAFIVLLVLSFVFYKTVMNSERFKTGERREMTKIPLEVKKNISKTATSSASFKIPILIYHYVEVVQDKKDTIRQSLNIMPYIFEKQLDTLKENGYTYITPSQLADAIDGKYSLPLKPVIISFDDGYMDFYTDVLPILKKHNTRVVAYIIPGKLDTLNYMYNWQLSDVLKSGLVEIGAHTVSHAWLKDASYTNAHYQIVESKKMLEDKLHIPITTFAYPSGGFDNQAIQIVKDAGFKTAVSTIPGNIANNANRFFLFRIHPGARTGQELIRGIEQNYPKPY